MGFGGLGFRVWGFGGLGFGGLGFRVWGFRFGGLGFRVWGFRVWGDLPLWVFELRIYLDLGRPSFARFKAKNNLYQGVSNQVPKYWCFRSQKL